MPPQENQNQTDQKSEPEIAENPVEQIIILPISTEANQSSNLSPNLPEQQFGDNLPSAEVSPVSPQTQQSQPIIQVPPKQQPPQTQTPSYAPSYVKAPEDKKAMEDKKIIERVVYKTDPSFVQYLLIKARAKIQERKRKKLDKIMRMFSDKKQITNKNIQKLLRVSDASATRYLDILERENKIKQVGKTGNAVFYVKI